MKTSKIKLSEIADFDNLREAFLRAARGKSSRSEVVEFRENLDAELNTLHDEILSLSPRVGSFRVFRIFEPKERIIHAPVFRERVLHHALVRKCEAEFERRLIEDSYACRVGKGREAALRRAEHFSRRCEWFLKLDVAKYFDSIPHALLVAQIEERFRDKKVVALWKTIVESYHSHTIGLGLPIGALTSQHLANAFLAPLDRFITEKLRLSAYVRYMDDMMVWSNDKSALKNAKNEVENFLLILGLRLNPKWHLQRTNNGADFLGYRVLRGASKLCRKSRHRLLQRHAWLERALENGVIDEREAQNRITAALAFAQVAKRETLPRRLFGDGETKTGTDHRATTASYAAAHGTTTRRTAVPPTATTTSRATATTTSVSALPSTPSAKNGVSPNNINGQTRSVSSSRHPTECPRQTTTPPPVSVREFFYIGSDTDTSPTAPASASFLQNPRYVLLTQLPLF